MSYQMINGQKVWVGPGIEPKAVNTDPLGLHNPVAPFVPAPEYDHDPSGYGTNQWNIPDPDPSGYAAWDFGDTSAYMNYQNPVDPWREMLNTRTSELDSIYGDFGTALSDASGTYSDALTAAQANYGGLLGAYDEQLGNIATSRGNIAKRIAELATGEVGVLGDGFYGEQLTDATAAAQAQFDLLAGDEGLYNTLKTEADAAATAAETAAKAGNKALAQQMTALANQLQTQASTAYGAERYALVDRFAAMEGSFLPDETGAYSGVKGQYTQTVDFLEGLRDDALAELARQEGYYETQFDTRKGRLEDFEEEAKDRIATDEDALLKRLGELKSGAATEMETVRTTEEKRLTDMISAYEGDIEAAAAALMAEGISPTELEALGASTTALLTSQKASQQDMLDRLARAEGVLGSERELAARGMTADAVRQLEGQLFADRAALEDQLADQLETIEAQKAPIAAQYKAGEFGAGQELASALDNIATQTLQAQSDYRNNMLQANQAQAASLAQANMQQTMADNQAAADKAAALAESQRTLELQLNQAQLDYDNTVAAAEAAALTGEFTTQVELEMALADASITLESAKLEHEQALDMLEIEAATTLATAQAQAQFNLASSLADNQYSQSVAQLQLTDEIADAKSAFESELAEKTAEAEKEAIDDYQRALSWTDTTNLVGQALADAGITVDDAMGLDNASLRMISEEVFSLWGDEAQALQDAEAEAAKQALLIPVFGPDVGGLWVNTAMDADDPRKFVEYDTTRPAGAIDNELMAHYTETEDPLFYMEPEDFFTTDPDAWWSPYQGRNEPTAIMSPPIAAGLPGMKLGSVEEGSDFRAIKQYAEIAGALDEATGDVDMEELAEYMQGVAAAAKAMSGG